MSGKIARIIRDLDSGDTDLRILALATIPRLSATTVSETEGELLERLRGCLEKAAADTNTDVVFLARKAMNALRRLEETARGASGAARSKEDAGKAPIRHEEERATTAPGPGAGEESAACRAEKTGEDDSAAVDSEPSRERLEVAVITALPKAADARELASLLSRLMECGGRKTLRVARTLLAHPDARVRSNAVELIERFGGPADVEVLLPLLKDSNNRVLGTVVKALGTLGYERTPILLRKMLASPHVSMRESGVFAAVALKDRFDLLDLLLAFVDDPYEGVRRRVVEALADYNDPRVTQALKARLSDDDEEVRRAAIRILESRGVNVDELLEHGMLERKVMALGEEFLGEAVEGMVEEVSPEADTSPGGRPHAGNAGEGASEAEAAGGTGEAPIEAEDTSDELLHTIIHRIEKEFRDEERRIRLSILLFELGVEVYSACRSGAIQVLPLLNVYYEVVKYQEYVARLVAEAREDAARRKVLEAGVTQYVARIRDCFVKLGKLAFELQKNGKLDLEGFKGTGPLAAFLSQAVKSSH